MVRSIQPSMAMAMGVLCLLALVSSSLLVQAQDDTHPTIVIDGHDHGNTDDITADSNTKMSCPVGKYVNGTSCRACPVGTEQPFPDYDGTSCPLCYPGDYAPTEGNRRCSPCPLYTYMPNAGASTCWACASANVSTGSYICPDGDRTSCGRGECVNKNGDERGCTPCMAGHYQPFDDWNLEYCYDCSPGYYQSLSGQSQCQACPVFTYQPSYSQVSCLPCSTVNYTGASSCPRNVTTSCSYGQYLSANDSSCTPCPSGHYQPFDRWEATYCYDCSPGYYQPWSGSYQCQMCPVQTYQPDYGQATCWSCPSVNFTGSSICPSSISCSPGRYVNRNNSVCEWCPVGTQQPYYDYSGSSCLQCSPGEYAPSIGYPRCSYCPIYTYQPSYGGSTCYDCASANTTGSSICPGDIIQCGPGQMVNGTQCVSCAAGYYQPYYGWQANYCYSCNPGTYSSWTGAIQCEQCPTFTYQPWSSASSCLTCATANFTGASSCPANITSSCGYGEHVSPSGGCVPCPVGTYQPFNRWEHSDCWACSPGTYAWYTGSQQCSYCPIHTFQPSYGGSSCLECASANYTGASSCASGNVTVTCQPGEYVEYGLYCRSCQPGTYQPYPGSASSCLSCYPGEYSNSYGADRCWACPAYSYAPYWASASCLYCPTINYTGASSCPSEMTCYAGTFVNANNGSCEACPRGRFQPDYSSTATSCMECQPGSYAPYERSGYCYSCYEHSYQPNYGADYCMYCPSMTGYGATYCPAMANPCTAGQFYNASRNACDACPIGSYQAATNHTHDYCPSCDMGRYQSQVGQSTCVSCASHYYQPRQGASTCLYCAVDTSVGAAYCNSTVTCSWGQHISENGTACIDCPLGTYQPYWGESMTSCYDCSPGSYAYWTRASSCSACPIRTYQPDAGATSCLSCPSVTYQGAYQCTSMNWTTTCNRGQYLDGNTCRSCMNGTYQPYDDTTYSWCYSCNPGTFQAKIGQPNCTLCPMYTYQPHSGASECLPCDGAHGDGWSYCPSSGGNGTCNSGTYLSYDNHTCVSCPSGRYQPYSGVTYTACDYCQPGTYSSYTGAQWCDSCYPGSYMPYWGMNYCYSCPTVTTWASSICPDANTTTICDPGYHVYVTGNGTINGCAACQPGTYQPYNSTQSTYCYSCSPGTFAGSWASQTCRYCPSHTYQPSYGGDVCWYCPEISYEGATECPRWNTTCTYGHYVNYTGGCSPCSAGTYQPWYSSTDTHCLSCAPGRYNKNDSASFCSDCGSQTYQPWSGQTSCWECPGQNTTGAYSCSGNTTTSCGVGHYVAWGHCQSCEAGHYQPFSSWDSTYCWSCSRGSYQPFEGSGRCEQCDIGTYQPFEGATQCLPCPTANYTGASSCPSNVTSSCSYGQYVNEWSHTCESCQAGRYQPFSSWTGTYCYDCSPGSYQPYWRSSQCQMCPVQTYQPDYGQATCLPCASVNYTGSSICPGGGLTCYSGSYVANDTTCRLCAPGTEQPYDHFTGTSCTQCYPGEYADSYGNHRCSPCPIQSYMPNWGASSCFNCSTAVTQGATICPQNVSYECTYGHRLRDGNCYSCDPGTYQPFGSWSNTYCWNCNAGRYTPFSGSESCIPCSAGSYQPFDGAMSCYPCPTANFTGSSVCPQNMTSTCSYGQRVSGFGSSCTSCEPGQYQPFSSWEHTYCWNCNAGRYQDQYGSENCNSCPAFTYQQYDGATSCVTCLTANYTGASSCPQNSTSSCGYGQYVSGYGSSCSLCYVGQYQPFSSWTNTYCWECGTGKYQASMGGDQCNNCPIGTYQPNTGSSSCLSCPEQHLSGSSTCPSVPSSCDQGQYLNRTQGRCDSCPSGFFQPYSSYSFEYCLPCAAGTYTPVSGSGKCAECPSYTYQPNSGSSSCWSCPSNPKTGSTTCDGERPKCGPGHYVNGSRCAPCASGSEQPFNDWTDNYCLACDAGSYAPGVGNARCSLCPQYSYSSSSGASECSSCPTQPHEGATTCPLTCEPGSYTSGSGTGQCYLCNSCTYQPYSGMPSCLPCYTSIAMGSTSCPAGVPLQQCLSSTQQSLVGKSPSNGATGGGIGVMSSMMIMVMTTIVMVIINMMI